MRAKGLFFGIAAMLVSSGVATAGEAAKAQPAKVSEADRVLYICDASIETRRGFEREYGPMQFVTAHQALAAIDDAQKWSAPRCITQAEHKRLKAMTAKKQIVQYSEARR